MLSAAGIAVGASWMLVVAMIPCFWLVVLVVLVGFLVFGVWCVVFGWRFVSGGGPYSADFWLVFGVWLALLWAWRPYEADSRRKVVWMFPLMKKKSQSPWSMVHRYTCWLHLCRE